jgi:hypothetical protein
MNGFSLASCAMKSSRREEVDSEDSQEVQDILFEDGSQKEADSLGVLE